MSNPHDSSVHIPFRTQIAIYLTGAFGNSTENVTSVIIPLWAVSLGASPVMIGIIIGSRHLLTMLFSIHGGALMDRLGTRRVLVAVSLIGAVVPLLVPLTPFIWTTILIQMIAGFSSTFGWMGAQAQVGEIMKGSAVHAGRMSFVLRFAQLGGPPAAGFAWDLGGPWGGFSFWAFWGTCLFLSSLALPRPTTTAPITTVRAADLVPRFADYVAAFRLLAVPSIALIVMLTIVRMGANGVQNSFYVVYLEEIGYPGTLIGTLLGACSLIGFAGSLSVGPLIRVLNRFWLLIGTVALGIALISITPLLGGVFTFLLAAIMLRGGTMGLSQPLMISILSQGAGTGNQGKGVGLRTTANRLTSLSIPVIMGTVVELVGLHWAFLVVGAALLTGIAGIALYARNATRITTEAEPT